MSKTHKLAIFLPSLASGGAEKLHITLAPEFVRNGWDVTFVLQQKKGALLNQLPAGVKLHSLDARRTISTYWPLRRYLKAHQPDVLLSNLGHNNIIAIAAGFGLGQTKIIATQHNTLSLECKHQASLSFRVLPLLSRFFLPKADRVVAVSQGVADDLVRFVGLAKEKIRVIYNPVIPNDFEEKLTTEISLPGDGSQPMLMAAGRLNQQKDFATLLKAFAIVHQKRPCRLTLFGEGEMEQELKSMATSLGIEKQVHFMGFCQNPFPYMHKANVLVVSSRYEGFGNVIAEALACGTQVVSTDCPHGPAEILDNGRFGRLVPVGNPDAMADAILETLQHPINSEILKQRGREFSVYNACAGYLALFGQ